MIHIWYATTHWFPIKKKNVKDPMLTSDIAYKDKGQ